MSVMPFQMKLTQQDQRLFGLLMAKHKLSSKADLVRKALIFYEKAPTAADPMEEALAKLEKFEASAQQSLKHRAIKKGFESGHRIGLGKAESLALLDQIQKPKNPKRGVHQNAEHIAR